LILIENLAKIYIKRNNKDIEYGLSTSLDLLSEILTDINLNNNINNYNITIHTLNIVVKELGKQNLLDRAISLIKDWSNHINPTT